MIRLHTLGSVDLQAPGGGDLRAVLAQPKRLALLVYLAAIRPAGVRRRDELLALFWPDQDDTRARDALNQALRFLRQALGADVLVSRGQDDVGVDPERIWCDAVAFQEALDGGRAEEAMALYRGDFLQGFFIEEGGGFEEWLERERTALRAKAAKGARQLAEEHSTAGALTLALDWGRKALELSPDDERGLRRILRLADHAGDRAFGLRMYEAFARRMEEEFGSQPSPETRAMAEQLRAGRPFSDDRPGGAIPPPAIQSPRPFANDPAAEIGDRYRIVRKLGAGGMATVYLATDLKHDREVALKVLRPEIAEGLARERFIREIRIAGRLQHPNIVPLFDSGVADGRLYYVMAHIEGETLRQRLAREGRFEIPLVLHILREIADALAYAHERGVIHRDIKPENILLIDRRAVLSDFGIARAAHAARTPAGPVDHTLTQPGTSLGTPAYMAPEQAAGNPEIDQRADLYALGVLGYEMLAGRPPFRGDTPQDILVAQLTEVAVPVGQVRSDTPAGLASLLMRCLEKKPAGRPASAGAFLEALDRPGSAMAAAGVDPPPAVRRGWVRLAPWAAGAALLLAGAWAVNQWSGGGLTDSGAEAPGSISAAAVDVFPSGDPRRIAVLYFDDLSAAKSLGHIASGLTEDLIDELSRVRGLHVISPTGVRPYKANPIPPDSLARSLEVGTLIAGSVTASGGRLRLAVRLIDGADARQLQSRTLELPMGDVLKLRDTLALEVSRFLRERLGQEIRLREERAGTKSVAAWELVQQAREVEREGVALAALDQPLAAIELLDRADASMQRASALDPAWVVPTLRRARIALALSFVSPAPAGAADSARSQGTEALEQGRMSASWISRALDLAEQALLQRPGSPEALAIRGELRYRRATLAYPAGPDSLIPLAKADLRDALDARPDLARAWSILGQMLANEGRFAEAAQAARNAFEADAFLDGVQSVLNDLFQSALYLEREGESRSWCRIGRSRFPANANFSQCELTLLGWLGKGRGEVDAAWQLLGEIERRDSVGVLSFMWGFRRMMVAAVLARSGLGDSARAVLRRVQREAADHPGNSDLGEVEAYVRLQLRERDAALRLLQTYVEAYPSARAYVARHPWYRDLRTDPRFRALVGLAG